TEYPLPDPAVQKGTHTPDTDKNGNIYFTLQSGHVGRIQPTTGEIRVVSPPEAPTTPEHYAACKVFPPPSIVCRYPYGLMIDSKGMACYADFYGPRLGSVDPKTMVIKEHVLPHIDSRPRRIAITPDDAVWYVDYARGTLGRLDQKTGKVKEWMS